MWPTDNFPIKGGGHTYLGFITVREKTFFKKGIVNPIPAGNFELLSDEYKESFRTGFAEKGYKLVTPADGDWDSEEEKV